MALEKSPDCGAAARDSMLAHRGNDLVESQIRLLADQSQQPFRMLRQRPLGFALALPVSRQRCNHFTAELALRLKLSAASRRDAPASTASITRSRKSSEYGLGIGLAPQTPNQCLQTRSPKDIWESPRFDPAGTCSNSIN